MYLSRTVFGLILIVCGAPALAEQTSRVDIAGPTTASSRLSTVVAPASNCSGQSYEQPCPVDAEKQVITLINLHRADSGSAPLVIDNRLFRAARCHSEDMYTNSCFQHDDCDGTSWVTRITSFNYDPPFSEVLCSGATTAEQAVTLWMSSPTHRHILIDAGYHHVGVGRAGDLWTVNVGPDQDSEVVPCLCCVGTRGNVNMTGIVDLSDLSALVSYLTGGGYVLTCPEAANVNGTGIVDLSDLSALVSYLTGGGYVLPSCP